MHRRPDSQSGRSGSCRQVGEASGPRVGLQGLALLTTDGIRAALSLGEDHSGQQKAEGNPESAAQAAQRKGSLKS